MSRVLTTPRVIAGTKQSVAYTGTAGTIANGFGSQTYFARIVVTSDAYVLIGDGTAAQTTTGFFMPASRPEVFAVSPGQKVSAVQVSSGGTLDVVEVE